MQFSPDELEAFLQTDELGTVGELTLGDGTVRRVAGVYSPPARNVPIAGVGVASFDRKYVTSETYAKGARGHEARLKVAGETFLVSEVNPDGSGLVELVLAEL